MCGGGGGWVGGWVCRMGKLKLLVIKYKLLVQSSQRLNKNEYLMA